MMNRCRETGAGANGLPLFPLLCRDLFRQVVEVDPALGHGLELCVQGLFLFGE